MPHCTNEYLADILGAVLFLLGIIIFASKNNPESEISRTGIKVPSSIILIVLGLGLFYEVADKKIPCRDDEENLSPFTMNDNITTTEGSPYFCIVHRKAKSNESITIVCKIIWQFDPTTDPCPKGEDIYSADLKVSENEEPDIKLNEFRKNKRESTFDTISVTHLVKADGSGNLGIRLYMMGGCSDKKVGVMVSKGSTIEFKKADSPPVSPQSVE